MLKQYAEWYMYDVICQMVGSMVLVLEHVIAQGLTYHESCNQTTYTMG